MAQVSSVQGQSIERVRRALEQQVAALGRRALGRIDARGQRLGAQQLGTEAAGAFRQAGDEVLTESLRELVEFDIDAELSTQTQASIKRQVNGIERDLGRLSSEASTDVGSIVRRVRSKKLPARAGRQQVAERLEKLQRDLLTTIDTGVAGLDRRVSLQQAEIAEVRFFLYDGPSDGRNRPFCRTLVDKWLTGEQVAQLRNNVGPQPASVYGGGWGCRHRFVALDEDELPEYEHYTGSLTNVGGV